MTSEIENQGNKRRLFLPWRSPELRESLYLALVRVVINNRAHVSTRDMVSENWRNAANDFWKQPEVDCSKYERVSVKQLRNIFDNLVAKRGEKFREADSGSLNDIAVQDDNLSPLDYCIRKIVIDIENFQSKGQKRGSKDLVDHASLDDNPVESGKKRRFKEFEYFDESQMYGTAPIGSLGHVRSGMVSDKPINFHTFRARQSDSADRYAEDIKKVESYLLEKFDDDEVSREILKAKIGEEKARFVVETFTMPVVITVFCERDHAFKMDYFKQQMVDCGLPLLDAIKLYTILKSCKNEFEK